VAPPLLARGERRLGTTAAGTTAAGEAALWLIGLIAVPAGDLADVRLLVLAGGAALLATLAAMARRALRRARRPDPGPRAGGRDLILHVGVVAFMVVSTFVGIALAWDTPWL
jgi:hypothetical protein